jgi:branched-subunit amino acid transport protein
MLADSWTPWVLIAGLSAIAFLSRALFVVPNRPLNLPAAAERLLRYAPAAALAAIVVPDLFRADAVATGGGGIVFNPRLYAGLVGLIVAVWSRSIVLTMVAGMAALIVGRMLL